MSIWFTAPYRLIGIAVIGLALTVLVLLAVISRQGVSERTVAASLLILSFMTFMVGGILFTGRAILKWPIADMDVYLRWERSFVILPTLATVLGLALLADLLRAAGDTYLSRLGLVAYLFGAALVVVAETTFISRHDWNYAQVVTYIMLALLAETAFGIALLQTGLVAAWVGWATIIWNLGALLILIVVRPSDMYYPVIHFVAPLLIGLALFAGG